MNSSQIKSLFSSVGVTKLLRYKVRDEVVVLMYHGVVADHELAAEGDWLQVKQSEFRAQMAHLAAHYEVVTFQQALDTTRSYQRPRAIITFDDGYANNLHIALPILEEFNLPATIFLATGFIGQTRLFWWDRLRLAARPEVLASEVFKRFKSIHPSQLDSAVAEFLAERGWAEPAVLDAYRPLTEAEIARVQQHPLITLGGHTHRHEIMTHLSSDEVDETLGLCRAGLDHYGIQGEYFAAPDGAFAEHLCAALQKHGFKLNVSTQPGRWLTNQNPFAIPRIGVGQGTQIPAFDWSLTKPY